MIVVRRSDLSFAPLPGRSTADPFPDVVTGGSVRVVVLGAADRRLAHRHPHSHELIYVASGSGAMWHDGSWDRFEPGDLLSVAPGEPHAGFADPGTITELVCFFPHPDLSQNYRETDTYVERPDSHHPGRENE